MNIQETYRNELMWGKPIIYKGATIHPIQLSEAYDFYMAVTALTFDQMQYPNKDIAFKPRLNFLLEMGTLSYQSKDINSIESQLWSCFCYLLFLIFKDQEVQLYDSANLNRKAISVTYETAIDGVTKKSTVVFGSKDFDEIRKIILVSNDVEFDDDFVHADIKTRMERDAKLLHKSKYTPPDLEDLVDIVFMYTGKDYDFIKNMNLRKFNRLIRRISLYEDYKIAKSASMSGFVTFKEEIQSWLSSLETKEKYKGLMQKKEDLVDKYKQINQ